MKSPELKNILLACGLAVFASVFAIGVNAAFGVSAPTVSPDTAGLIGPTFSDVTTTDLDVRGDIVNGDVGNPVRVNGPFEATDTVTIGNNTLIDNGGDLTVEGETTISSSQDANTSGNGALRIGATPATRMLIDNNEILSLSKLYINYGGGQDVQIGASDFPSDVEVFGNMIIRQVLTIAGGIMSDGISDGTDATAGSVMLNDELDIGGAIKNTRTVDSPLALGIQQPVTIDDSLSVSGFISTSGIFGGAYWEPFPVYYPQVISLLRVAYDSAVGSNTGEIWVQDYLTDTPTTGGPVLELTPNQINERKGTITLQYWNNRDVQIGPSSSITSDLDVNGAVTAQSFGSIYHRPSTRLAISAGSSVSASAACDSGDRILSCGAETTLNSNGTGIPTNIMLTNVRPDITNTCYARATNTGASGTRYILALAICISPDG